MTFRKKLSLISLIMIMIMLTSGCSLISQGKGFIRSSEGHIHKAFGSSNSMDTKQFQVKVPGDYRFRMKAHVKSGSLTISLLDSEKKSIFELEESSLRTEKNIHLESGVYYLRIQTHEASNGDIDIIYERMR